MRHAYAGGTELFINQLAPYLVNQGHEVTIICRSHEAAPAPGVRFVALKSFAIGKAMRMWRFAKAVENHLRHHEYDLVYGLGKTWSHDLIRIGGGTHKSFQLSTYGKEKHRLKDIVTRRIEAKALKPGAYRHVVANSEKTKRELVKDYQVPADQITVIHNAVDTSRFNREQHRDAAGALREKLGLKSSTFLYLFLGSGYQRKGLDIALKAFASALQPHPDSHLAIVGYDSNQGEYEALARSLNIERHVSFLGGRRDPEVCYAAADCYVLPTRYEPFGYSVIEALASGVPVITSRQCGASEVVHSEVASVLDAEAPPEHWGEAMIHWQKQTGSRLHERCCQQVEALAVEQVMQRNTEALLKVALEKRGA
nr:glycosyltransferase family 4 protein [Motiliproteus sp. SC1-56]